MENASVQRGLFLTFCGFPSSVTASGRATFPVGEGDLRRGRRSEVLRIYAPVPPGRLRADVGIRPYARERAGGDLKIQRCRQISVDVVADGLFLQDSDFSYLGSFRNPSP